MGNFLKNLKNNIHLWLSDKDKSSLIDDKIDSLDKTKELIINPYDFENNLSSINSDDLSKILLFIDILSKKYKTISSLDNNCAIINYYPNNIKVNSKSNLISISIRINNEGIYQIVSECANLFADSKYISNINDLIEYLKFITE